MLDFGVSLVLNASVNPPLIGSWLEWQVGVEPGEVEASRYQEYRPEYRSGGFTVCGIRDTLEDALVCIDDLEEHLGSRGAFYGVSGQCITQCCSGIVFFIPFRYL